jgi:hypothetical protein
MILFDSFSGVSVDVTKNAADIPIYGSEVYFRIP